MKHAPPAPPELGEHDGLSYALFLPEETRDGGRGDPARRRIGQGEPLRLRPRCAATSGWRRWPTTPAGTGARRASSGPRAFGDALAMCDLLREHAPQVALRGSSMGGFMRHPRRGAATRRSPPWWPSAPRRRTCCCAGCAPGELRGLRGGRDGHGGVARVARPLPRPRPSWASRPPCCCSTRAGDEQVPYTVSEELHAGRARAQAAAGLSRAATTARSSTTWRSRTCRGASSRTRRRVARAARERPSAATSCCWACPPRVSTISDSALPGVGHALAELGVHLADGLAHVAGDLLHGVAGARWSRPERRAPGPRERPVRGPRPGARRARGAADRGRRGGARPAAALSAAARRRRGPRAVAARAGGAPAPAAGRPRPPPRLPGAASARHPGGPVDRERRTGRRRPPGPEPARRVAARPCVERHQRADHDQKQGRGAPPARLPCRGLRCKPWLLSLGWGTHQG